MLKVGLVTNEFFPVWGGVSTYCINLCRGLVDQVELHVFTNIKSYDEFDTLFTAYPNLKKAKFHSLAACNTGISSTFRFQLCGLSKLPRLIAENKIDIIHTSTFLSDALYRLAGIKVPNVLTVHTTINGQVRGFLQTRTSLKNLDPSELFTLAAYPILCLGESASMHRAPNVIAVSRSVADELKGKIRNIRNMNVVYNGIDLDVFHPRPRDTAARKRVLFVGRIVARKGVSTLINAMPAVLQTHPDAVFVFAGSGQSAPYREHLKRLGIPEKNYEFVTVSYAQIGSMYRASDIFVLPSFMESCPMSILEATASGLPVVATNVNDIPYLVNHGINGYLVPPGDHRSLAKYLDILLGDPALRQAMGAASRKIAEESFSYNKMASQTLEVYRKVIGQ